MKPVVNLTAVIGALGLWSAVSADANNQIVVKAQPVARFVLESTSTAPFDEFVSHLDQGYLNYSDEFRHPFLPEGPLEIDCAIADRIGVTYALSVPVEGRGKWMTAGSTFSIRFTWEHDSLQLRRPRADHRHQFVLSHKEGIWLQNERMDLTWWRRVNGVVTVTAYFEDDRLFESQFKLAGCENHKSAWEKWQESGERPEPEPRELQEDPDELPFY